MAWSFENSRYEWCDGDTPEAGADINFIRRKHKDDESASDDETYKFFDVFEQEVWQKASEKSLRCATVTVHEPYIMPHYTDKPDNSMVISRRVEGENLCVISMLREDFLEASKRLKECYVDVLVYIAKDLDEDGVTEKKIAIPTLSTEVGFPRYAAAKIAVSTIFKFIKNNPGVYVVIELFVKKRSEVTWYKKFLERYAAKK